MLTVWLALGLAGCANESMDAKAPSPAALMKPPAMASTVALVQYHCDDGTRFSVSFDDAADTATLTGIGDAPVVLPQQATADGFDYGNGEYDLRGRGDDATWKAGDKPAVKCSAAPPQ